MKFWNITNPFIYTVTNIVGFSHMIYTLYRGHKSYKTSEEDSLFKKFVKRYIKKENNIE